MMFRVIVLSSAMVFLLVASGLATSALAQDGNKKKTESAPAKPTAEDIVKFMDKNRNGKIDKAEASKELQANFHYLDTNNDGAIDVKEAAPMAAYADKSKTQPKAQSNTASTKVTAKSMLASMDQNGDGKISKEEAPAQLKPHFEGIDTNGDGSIDVNEAKVMADYANSQQGESTADQNSELTSEATGEKVIALLDKNGDGKISKEESKGEVAKNFAFIDNNNDGLVDATEAQSALDYAKQSGAPVTMDQLNSAADKPEGKKAELNTNRKPEELVALIDKNGDGKITKQEAPEDLVLFFGNYDINDDGMIDKKESTALVAYLNATPVEASDAKPASEQVTAESVMKQIDANGDGKVTKEEAPPQLKSAWAYIDANKDGVIDLKEAQAIADYQNSQK